MQWHLLWFPILLSNRDPEHDNYNKNHISFGNTSDINLNLFNLWFDDNSLQVSSFFACLTNNTSNIFLPYGSAYNPSRINLFFTP